MDGAFPVDQSQQAVADAPSLNPVDQQIPQDQVDDAGQDGATPTEPANDAAAELARIRADYQQTQAQLEQERQARQQSEQVIAAHQRQIAEDAARQWANAEQDLIASDPDPETTRQFYKAREQFLLSQFQETQKQAETERQRAYVERVNAFAAHIAKESGLAEQDAQALLMTPGAYQNPNVMTQAAQTLKQSREASNTELQKANDRIARLELMLTGQGIKPAWQTGGANGSAAASSIYDPKSPDYDSNAHYQALMQHGRPAN